jgi:hypothetical protein
MIQQAMEAERTGPYNDVSGTHAMMASLSDSSNDSSSDSSSDLSSDSSSDLSRDSALDDDDDDDDDDTTDIDALTRRFEAYSRAITPQGHTHTFRGGAIFGRHNDSVLDFNKSVPLRF